MKIAVVVGTRPEIIKMQSVVKEIQRKHELHMVFIHTGQHYDRSMSDVFIKELNLPEPSYFLNVKSGSHGIQTARIIDRSERILKQEKPNIVLVQGDTNSALGVALTASKLKIPVGHVEAGCRSFDKNMPEEVNRVLIADLASLHFAPTETCVQNLIKEGIPKEQIHLTGHTIVDLLDQIKHRINENVVTRLGLRKKEYYLATIHREENVESKTRLKNLFEALSRLAESRPIVFPIHPHTQKSVNRFRLQKHLEDIMRIDPVGYIDALSLIKFARVVLTDSGGIQQEAALLGTPCITLRNSTEWIETIKHGINFMASSEEEITMTAKRIETDYEDIMERFESAKTIFGLHGVSARIVGILEEAYSG